MYLQAVNPGQVRGYLQRAFKEQLGAVQSAMQQLANAYSPEEVGKRGYDLYVDFRWDQTRKAYVCQLPTPCKLPVIRLAKYPM